VRIQWQPSPHQGAAGYLVYRQDDRWEDSKVSRLTREPIREPGFLDETAGGRPRRYHVVVVDALGQEGIPSAPVWGFRPWRAHYAPWAPAGSWHQ